MGVNGPGSLSPVPMGGAGCPRACPPTPWPRPRPTPLRVTAGLWVTNLRLDRRPLRRLRHSGEPGQSRQTKFRAQWPPLSARKRPRHVQVTAEFQQVASSRVHRPRARTQKGADCRSRINMPQARTDTMSGVNRTSRKRSKKQTNGALGPTVSARAAGAPRGDTSRRGSGSVGIGTKF